MKWEKFVNLSTTTNMTSLDLDLAIHKKYMSQILLDNYLYVKKISDTKFMTFGPNVK